MKLAFTQRIGKEVKTFETEVSDTTMELIKVGMNQAIDVSNYWAENCEAIVGQFWGDVETAGFTKSTLLTAMREAQSPDVEGQKAYSVAFQAFVQSNRWYETAIAKRAEQEAHPKGSEKYETAKHAANGYFDDARTTASQQLRAVLNHFVKRMFDEEATGDARKLQDARQKMQAAIADWTATVALARGKFAESAERVFLTRGIEALRAVVNANPASVVSRTVAAPKPEAEAKPENVGVTLTPEQYAEAVATEQAERDAAQHKADATAAVSRKRETRRGKK